MRVYILLFGALKDLRSRGGESPVIETMDLPEHCSVRQLIDQFAAEVPQIEGFAGSLAIAVNREYASSSHILQDGDEVALLPPVSGGSSVDDPQNTPYIRLQREPIHTAYLIDKLKNGADGAVVIFDGIVRDNTRGRRTLHLDYEAYETMALEQMRSLALQAKERFEVREIALVHRLGRLEIGETSVWIAVSSAHRAAAFEACRWLIDTLKKTVPIWKKEFFEDGAVWADGEPFPEAISLPRRIQRSS